ncbi:class I adenylate-forming enzyme family protein [Streptomyces pseudovenezuelae]|uniref:class I adenylate-forming enzyme family protein n=1 Tax=Streptomyces pseudovenezuelae TaxID=67350 RepID=UPI0036E2C1DB
MWLTQILDRNRRWRGEETALVDGRGTVTWAELDERVHARAGALLALGLGPGDRVLLLAPERVEVFEAYFALARIGAVAVPLDPLGPTEEAATVARHTNASAVVADLSAATWAHDLGVPLVLDLAGPWGGTPELPPYQGTWPLVRPDDPLAVMHTSATTGRARGVVWDHRSLMQVCLAWSAAAGPAEGATLVNCAPLFHSSVAMSFAYMAAGARIVLPRAAAPQRTLEAVARHRATHLWLDPESLRHLADAARAGDHDTGSLREIVYGGAPLPWEVYRAAARVFGCAFRQAYGAAEAGGHFAMLAPHEHPSADTAPEVPPVLGAGQPLPGVDVRVRRPDGSEAATGENGEICVRSDSLMRGYWGEPRATAEAMRDGWLHTGDLGRTDETGHLTLVGRQIDVITSSGRDIHPAEIERVLLSHDAVADTAVVGRRDSAHGEVPIAYVVPVTSAARPTPDELSRLLSAELASHQPAPLITFLDSLPRNRSGKVLKTLLRTMAEEH